MASHPQRSDMEKELALLWSKSIEQLPVYKDLPRLAGRITVEGEFSAPPKPQKKRLSVLESKPEDRTVREFLCDQAQQLKQDPKTVEEFISALERDWYFHVDSSLLLISDSKWKDFGIPDRLVQALKKEAQNSKSTRNSKEQKFLSVPKSLSSFRLSATGLEAKDIQEAIAITDKLQDVQPADKEEEKEEDMNKKLIKEIKRVVLDIARRLETRENYERITEEFEKLLKQEKYGDMQLTIEDLFKQAIGLDSRTARVLKAIHQNIIFVAVFQLKSKLPMTGMTRDVRTREGWRIHVLFNNNVIVVSHRRREQSLATAPADEQYWFEWELRMLFDEQLKDLESSVLSITDVGFEPNISAKKREEINKALSHGNLIVS